MSDEVLREIENLVARVKHGAYVDDALEELARIAREQYLEAEGERRVANEMCDRAEKAEARAHALEEGLERAEEDGARLREALEQIADMDIGFDASELVMKARAALRGRSEP